MQVSKKIRSHFPTSGRKQVYGQLP